MKRLRQGIWCVVTVILVWPVMILSILGFRSPHHWLDYAINHTSDPELEGYL